MNERVLRFQASQSSGDVRAILLRPDGANWLLVLGHGAGAGMHHPFMQRVAAKLAEHDIATLRYQFPYMEQGKRAPNPQPVLMKTVRNAVAAARRAAPELPLLAGGKSLGGRMTSNAAASETLAEVQGIVFFGFPLHAPGKPSNHRAEHLYDIGLPMLFLQGTRDKLADLDLLRPVCDRLGAHATLHIIEDADHSFNVPKKTGRSQEQIIAELAGSVKRWASKLV